MAAIQYVYHVISYGISPMAFLLHPIEGHIYFIGFLKMKPYGYEFHFGRGFNF